MAIAIPPSDFNAEFASPADWAAMYRACGLQVIPCKDKRPDLSKWADLQETLVGDATFSRWYGPAGDHRASPNMGFITGACSGNVFVLDFDTAQAVAWWRTLLENENSGLEPETAGQRTGGGGSHRLFRAPPGYRVPTGVSKIGVDVRGQGGFAVLPPTIHASGRAYQWHDDHGPWEFPIADAPPWLLHAINVLLGLVPAEGQTQNEFLTQDFSAPAQTGNAGDEFALRGFQHVRIDGREEPMADMVWAAIVNHYRDNPIRPGEAEQRQQAAEAFAVYARTHGPKQTGVDTVEGLEREGRGLTEFWKKWQAAMRKWDNKVASDAAKPRPAGDNWGTRNAAPDFTAAAQRPASGAIFEYLNVEQILALPDPKWLIDRLMIENSLGIIYGPPGSLKSFISLDVALSLATRQKQWWGYGIGHTGTVVYISSEGIGNYKFRLRAWAAHRGVDIAGAPFRLIKQPMNFMEPGDIGKLVGTVHAIVAETGPVAAVFVDTLSRVLPGAEENLQKDMSIFVAACDAVRNTFTTTVVGIHHTNYAGGLRGSTVIPGAGDFLLETRREPGAMIGSIFVKKVKDGEDGWERHFEVKKVPVGDLGGATSLVVDGVSDDANRPSGNALGSAIRLEILNAIDDQWNKGRPWCHAKNSPNNAITNICRKWRIKRETAEGLLNEWNNDGVIGEEILDAKRRIKGYRKLFKPGPN